MRRYHSSVWHFGRRFFERNTGEKINTSVSKRSKCRKSPAFKIAIFERFTKVSKVVFGKE